MVVAFSGSAFASDLPKVAEDDPSAAALGYLEDTTKVDAAKYPAHGGDVSKMCVSCALYTGKDGDDYGPCAIFPGKSVAAKGWCTAYAPKPA